ncbi:MAG: hypothetical protein OM95_15825 [Bdellovibrio sp. ArHS]|uniref:phytoene/squalene synthase family protein n=1 Tax=Bdellovibrio sp. ArHS TaxID=1569284 RepID=UPI000583BDAF|nr:phytoene/squalene synthase family protein [Bdellovibrio sp. ArHS]KHD87163.1 MAG: hypothetical protein OM95_15825 [Bdellovibrio sp. ArHS]
MKTAAKKAIEEGSKSFYLASLFFDRQTKADCWALYRWCRHCDDVIDNGGSSVDLEELKIRTVNGLRAPSDDEIFSDLGKVCRRHGIPAQFPLELLAGFKKDTSSVRIKTESELDTYAYQVAGVVGLMMSYLMKADLAVAKEAAVSLGNAMQLTNIARDIKEDYQKDRIYLPGTWLEEEHIDSAQLLHEGQRDKVFSLVQRLLKKADALYEEGRQGLKYLPVRSALAVAIAAAVYSQIGHKILKLGPASLESRIYVSLPQKILLIGRGIFWVIQSFSQRLVFWRSNAKA